MKNFKKYVLISLASAGISTCVVSANETNTQEPEVKTTEVQPVVKQDNNDQNNQIVPVAPATEQQIVKIEEQKQEAKTENTKPEEVKKEESFEDLLKFTTSQKAQFLIEKLKTIKRETNKEEQEKTLKVLAYWLKAEWKSQEKNNLSEDLYDKTLDTLAETYLSSSEDDDELDDIYNKIYKIKDIYEPYILKQLFPELEKELKEINLSERHFSQTIIKGTKKAYSSIDLYFSVPEKVCLEIAKKHSANFKKLEFQHQFIILACWITMEFYYKLG